MNDSDWIRKEIAKYVSLSEDVIFQLKKLYGHILESGTDTETALRYGRDYIDILKQHITKTEDLLKKFK